MTDFGGRRVTDFPLERLPELLRSVADQIEELAVKPSRFMLPMSLGKIRSSVCEAWDVSEIALLSNRRSTEIVHPRFAGYRLSKELTPCSFAVIGNSFKRDHTTIIHGVDRAKALLKESPDFREKYNKCLSVLSDDVRELHERSSRLI